MCIFHVNVLILLRGKWVSLAEWGKRAYTWKCKLKSTVSFDKVVSSFNCYYY